jgi:hypothetical protein
MEETAWIGAALAQVATLGAWLRERRARVRLEAEAAVEVDGFRAELADEISRSLGKGRDV